MIRKGSRLTRIRPVGFESGLQEMGSQGDEAERLTSDCGQNLSVLRRQLQIVANQKQNGKLW